MVSIKVTGQSGWQWTVLTDMPEPVSNNAIIAATVNGIPYVYSFAGIDSTKKYSGIHLKSFRYNTITFKWDTIPSLPDTMGKIAAGASTIKNKIYIIGGYHVFQNGSEKSSSLVHIYDPENNTYSNGTDIPVAIDDHVQATWRDSLIFIITGWSNSTNVNNVQIYNPNSDSWMTGTPTPNTTNYKVFGGSGIIIEDTIYYAGGAAIGSNFQLNNTFRKGVIDPKDPTTITWTELDTIPGSDGYRMGVFNNWGRIFWVGGSGESYNYDGKAYTNGAGVDPLDRIIQYNTSNQTWTEHSSTPYPVMDMRGVAKIFENTYIIAGGMLKDQEVSKKTYLLLYTTTFGLTDIKQKGKIKIYPNPVSRELILEDSNILPVEIFDISGKLVLQQENIGNDPKRKIDVSWLSNGIYLIKMYGEKDEISMKFQVVH